MSHYDARWGGRTVLADRSKTLFELPAGTADEGERFENFDGLRSMNETSQVELRETLGGTAFSHALIKIYDILACSCRRESS